MKQPRHRSKLLGRRRCVKQLTGGLTLAAFAPGFALTACDNGETAAKTPQNPVANGPFDVELRLTAGADRVAIKNGPASEVWRYTGKLLGGSDDSLVREDDSFLGPTVRLRRGQRVRVEITNEIPEDTTVHWHGLHVPPIADGQPRHPIKPGETRTVAFDVADRAGLYWYHPHPHGPSGGRVGFQACAGLAGPLIIKDETEDRLDLPTGDEELVMVLQDRRFNADNELEYMPEGMSAMMTRMHGFHGDELLVNGRPAGARNVSTRPYRLRLLNGSNARIYRLAWSDGRPVTLLGTDGGLLTEPTNYPFVTLAPAERRDVWVDFTGTAVGDTVELFSEAFSAGGMDPGMMNDGMMGGRMGGMMDGDGMMRRMNTGRDRMRVTSFQVTQRVSVDGRLPQRLASDPGIPRIDDATTVRRFELGMRMMRGFTINGRRMEGPSVADDEVVALGQTEIWEFHNTTMMPHPMHVHGLQFGIVDRTGGEGSDLRSGLVDQGRHDTVLVLPGERVRIALNFRDFTGLYMYHCHNMEHEDNGMMRYYKVT